MTCRNLVSLNCTLCIDSNDLINVLISLSSSVIVRSLSQLTRTVIKFCNITACVFCWNCDIKIVDCCTCCSNWAIDCTFVDCIVDSVACNERNLAVLAFTTCTCFVISSCCCCKYFNSSSNTELVCSNAFTCVNFSC